MTDRVIVKLHISGAVQGVGFRMWMHRQCTAMGLQGWARNCRDGSVEAVLAGPSAAVDKMTESCRRGPAAARVKAVDVAPCGAEELAARSPGATFDVLPTK